MNYLERVQRAYDYARKNEGLLKSLTLSFGQEQASLAMKSGRDETARMMMEIAMKPAGSAVSMSEMAGRMEQACFGNPSLYSYYMEKLQDFSNACNHSRGQVMAAIGQLYDVRVPDLIIENRQKDDFWGNPHQWDACVLQNPEIAAVSPYTTETNYAHALIQSQERLHDYLVDQLQYKDFRIEDLCRLMLEDKDLHLEMEDYKEIICEQPRLGFLLPREVLESEDFREALLESDPIGALRSIPKEEQTDSIRLRAISKNAEAFRWIDDDDFKRRHFTLQEMIPLRIENQPTLEQCQLIEEKATALLGTIEDGNAERREQIAEQNWMEKLQSREKVEEASHEGKHVPKDFSEEAKFHYHEEVKSDDAQEQYCYYDDADGSLDYNRDTQKFTFTSRDGRKSDMTESMKTLQRSGRTFQSLSVEEKNSFLALRDFSLADSQGQVQDYVAQKAVDGSVSFMSRLSSKAANSATAMAVGKAKKLWDDAMAAGQL